MPLVRANGLDIAFETGGDPKAPPLLLVMGLGMPLAFWPDLLVEKLQAAGFYVVRFDNRDCGLSSRIDARPAISIPVGIARAVLGMQVQAPYDLADMAADAAGLLDALGIEQAHVVGASLGGMIAQVLAARRPGRVASLTSIMSGSGNPFVSMARPRALGAILHRPEHPGDVDAIAEHLVHVLEIIGSPAYPADPAMVRALCERTARRGYDTHGVARQMLAMLASGDRRAEIAAIRAPTLVIHGREDPLIPRAAGREVARLIPGARYLEFDGMGHDLPPVLVPAIVDAIARLGQVSGTVPENRPGEPSP